MQWQRLAPGVSRLWCRWGLGDNFESVLGEGDLGVFEHVIHEVAHMVSLNDSLGEHFSRNCLPLLKFKACTPITIGNTLRFKKIEVQEETRAWLIEWNVWKMVGLTSVFEWYDVIDGADIQGCSHRELERLKDVPLYEQLGTKALAELRRLSDLGERLMFKRGEKVELR